MEPFIGMIVMFGGNFAPRSWALCDGQLLSISANTALFSILGTTYGGDGRTTFGLPDLRGRVPMHAGNGPGLSSRSLGQKSGTETNVMSESQLAAHVHPFAQPANSNDGTSNDPEDNFPAAHTGAFLGSSDVTLGGGNTGSVGSSTAVNNVQPFQVVNFIIALVGIFPSRN